MMSSTSPSFSSSSSFNNDTYESSTSKSNFSNSNSTEQIIDQEWFTVLTTVFTASIMIFIIVAAIFGNLLVIISVMRVRKLRYGLILMIMSTDNF